MSLKMPHPTRDDKTGIFYLRVRVPSDLVAKVRSQPITLPVGEQLVSTRAGDAVKLSLRTRDPREAKQRFSAAYASLNAYWEAVRQGPIPLTHKQAVALAGEIYRVWVSAFEDTPGSSELWNHVIAVNETAREGRFGLTNLKIGLTDAERRASSLNERYGPITDAFLRGKGLVIDAASRERVIAAVGDALTQAALQARKFSEGDYSPDPKASRFPAFESATKGSSGSLTLTELFEAWGREASQLKRAAATNRRYRSVFSNFRAFLKHDDATAVTAEDVIRYKDERLSQGISGKTLKDADLAALKSVFGWAVENKRLPSNPAGEVTVRVGRKVVERERGFNDKEAQAILRAALAHKRGRQESLGLAAAKRWVPWLCAFTGARVSEITALQLESFSVRSKVPTVRIMGTKTGEYRDVPLHPQLVELGLLSFLEAATSGPLFFDRKGRSGNGAEYQSQKLAKWVRSLGITDQRVKPNHGWRHRFTTVARSVSMDHEKREYLLGHALPGLGSVYGDMAGLYAEVLKLPRIELD